MSQIVRLKRHADAQWKGSGLEGEGKISTQSKAFQDQPYSFKTRFQSEDGKLGTNPEELIAAAHSACFNMALSFQLGSAGFIPKELYTSAELIMEKVNGHFEIKEVILSLEGHIEGIKKEQFLQIAENAKKTCPVSQALSAIKISLIIKNLEQ